MRQRFLTALHAFHVIMSGEHHVFQSKEYTSLKGTEDTAVDAIQKLKSIAWDDSTQIIGYWEHRGLNK